MPSGPGRVRPQARMPPVEVPAIRSNSSAVGRPVRRSISASTRAGIRPRMPPPSIERTFMRAAKTRDPPDLRAGRPRQAGATMTHLSKRFLLLGAFACRARRRPARRRAGPACRHRRARVHQLGAEHAVARVARHERRRRLPREVRLLREQRARRQPDLRHAQRREQPVGQLVRRQDAPARRPVRHLRPGLLVAAERLAVLPRRPELVLDGHAARPPRAHDDRPLQAGDVDRARGRQAVHQRRQGRRSRSASPTTSRARSRPTSCASSSAARPTSATPTPASSTATTRPARCPRAAASRRRSPAPPTSARAASPRPTAPCGPA